MRLFFKTIFSTILVCVTSITFCQVKLPAIIRDSMILQRDKKINIWGWAGVGEKVRIHFNHTTYKTTTNKNGKWIIQLPPMKAGGPFTMEISGRNKIVLHDILFGDVWLCAGQSNMEHQMKLHAVYYADEIANADNPNIRQFKIPNTTNLVQPQDDLNGGSWKCANPTDVKEFSAVAYFFAKALYEKYHVPIGIINASWGGIPIEAMMSEDALIDFPSVLSTVEKNKDTGYVNASNRKAFIEMQAKPKPDDKGITGKWYDVNYIPKDWKRIAVPGFWEDQVLKNLDGAVWYRKEINVPASLLNKPAKIFLGRIVDADELYINGTKVGATGYMYPQRRYTIPGNVLKLGKNILIVHVTNNYGKGGFVPDKPYQLFAGNDTIDLSGYWQYKVGYVKSPLNTISNTGITLQYQPTALYNSMIAPLIHYSIKGFVWYQGESNTGNAGEYSKLQPAMIKDWRKKWNDSDIPFLFVQLPGFGDYDFQPGESQWAEFRSAQAKSLLVPNTAMAVAIDVGEWNDVHPDNKKPVGERLAAAAEKIAYNENIVYSGPVFQSATIEGNKIIVTFTNTGSGLIFKGASYISPLAGDATGAFYIAGDDKKFVTAIAKIEGNTIIVTSNEITAPTYVRYAWADNPLHPDLYNKEGLPAVPFNTETISMEKKIKGTGR